LIKMKRGLAWLWCPLAAAFAASAAITNDAARVRRKTRRRRTLWPRRAQLRPQVRGDLARRGGGPCVSVTGAMVQMSHILTAAEGELGAPMRHAHGRHQAYEELDGAEIHVTLDDRELWTKFQCLTNEMIVTKNGRYAKTQRRQADFEKKNVATGYELILRKKENSCF
jgi:T-box